jgi:hypothetical protein
MAVEEEEVLPLDLDILSLLVQYHVREGNIGPEHVAYQSLYHLLLSATFGHENFPKALREHAGNFEHLKSIQETLQLRTSRATMELLRGRGAAAGAPTSPFDVLRRRNFGLFSTTTVTRNLPQRCLSDGAQITDVLNFAAGLKGANALNFSPVHGKRVYPVVLSMDGAAISAGLQTDEQRLVNVGLVGGDQTVGDVKMLRRMSEEEVRTTKVTV